MGQHLPGPGHSLGFQALQRHHRIHQPHGQGLAGVVAAAEEPDLAGLALPHHPGEVTGAEAPVKTAHPGPGLAEDGVISRQAEVAEQVKHLATADRVPGHQGDHHLRQAADQALQVEHVESGQARVVEVTPVAPHALVAAGAEGPHPIGGGAVAGEQHHPDAGVIADPGQGITEFLHRAGSEGVALFRSVDADPGDALLAAQEADVAVCAYGFPLHRGRLAGGGRCAHLEAEASAAIVRSRRRNSASWRRSVRTTNRLKG